MPTGTTFAGTRVGGLSSITYDERRGVYYAVSDDPADVRYYTLRLDRATGADRGDHSTPSRRLLAPGGAAVRAVQPRSRGARADQGPRADLHLGGDRQHRRRPVRAPLLARRDLRRATCRCRGRSCPNAGAHARRAPEPRLRERGRGAERPLPLHRDRERARPGRPGRDDRERQPGADPALPAEDRPARPPVGLRDRPGRRAAGTRRRRSRSTASSSCCRSTTASCSRWSARSRSARPDTGNTIRIYRVSLPGRGGTASKDARARPRRCSGSRSTTSRA